METHSQKTTKRYWTGTIGFALLLMAAHSGSTTAQTTNTFPQNGNAGIGTTSPSAPLTITTDGNVVDGTYYSTLTIRKTGDTFTGLRFDKNSTALFRLGTDPINNFQISRLTGPGSPDDSAFYLNQSGNVGIGTATPGTYFGNPARLNVTNNSSHSNLAVNAATGFASQVIFAENANGKWIISSRNTLDSPNNRLSILNSSPTEVFTILNGGNIGIGVTNPQYKLDVAGNINSSATITGINIVAKYQDVAEWVPASGQLPAGTVVVLDTTKSNQVITSTEAYDTRVAGVVSEQPGIALGESGQGKVLVATTGRVLVKVDATSGPIHIGDLLVTSDIPGVAMKSEPISIGNRKFHTPGTLIGKALEPLEKGSGKILVLLSLQ